MSRVATRYLPMPGLLATSKQVPILAEFHSEMYRIDININLICTSLDLWNETKPPDVTCHIFSSHLLNKKLNIEVHLSFGRTEQL